MNFNEEQKKFIYELVNKFVYKTKEEINDKIKEMTLIKKSSEMIAEDIDIYHNRYTGPILGPNNIQPIIPNYGINNIDMKTIHQCLYCNMEFDEKDKLYDHLKFFHNKMN